MKPYSKDLRLRVLAAVDSGVVPREEVAKTFSVSVPTIKRWLKRRDLNPIEEAFSKIKSIVRKVGVRTREVLEEAIERALAAVSRPKRRQAGSLTLAMSRRINPYEYRCQRRVTDGS
jgi:transposase